MGQAAQFLAGMLEPGNIDLAHRPRVLNPDGSISTVYSRSGPDAQGREVLIPSVIPSAQGGYYTDTSRAGDPSWDYYRRTGQHLGIFSTPDAADAYARQLHNDYAAGRYDMSGKPNLSVNGAPIEMAVSHSQLPQPSLMRDLFMRLLSR